MISWRRRPARRSHELGSEAEDFNRHIALDRRGRDFDWSEEHRPGAKTRARRNDQDHNDPDRAGPFRTRQPIPNDAETSLTRKATIVVAPMTIDAVNGNPSEPMLCASSRPSSTRTTPTER